MDRVLVTGANRRIGLALAKEFVKNGYYVIATCREPEKASKLSKLNEDKPDNLEIVGLDVTSDDSVGKAFEEISGRYDRTDVLYNNAGIASGPLYDSLEDADFDDFHTAFETNSPGPLRVTRTFPPLLNLSDRPLVVNMTSGLGEITKHYNKGISYVYGASRRP